MTDSPRKSDGYIVRGKTPAEIQARADAKEAHDNAPLCSITLTNREYAEFEVATSNAEYLLSNAQYIFEELNSGLATMGIDAQSSGFPAILEMCGRGFKDAVNDEGDKLRMLADKIRSAKELSNADQQ